MVYVILGLAGASIVALLVYCFKSLTRLRFANSAAIEYRQLATALPTIATRAEFRFWEQEVNSFYNKYRGQIPSNVFYAYEAVLESLLKRALSTGFTKEGGG